MESCVVFRWPPRVAGVALARHTLGVAGETARSFHRQFTESLSYYIRPVWKTHPRSDTVYLDVKSDKQTNDNSLSFEEGWFDVLSSGNVLNGGVELKRPITCHQNKFA